MEPKGNDMTLRVCPMRDATCPHGMDCPHVGDGPYGYPCKEGWSLSFRPKGNGMADELVEFAKDVIRQSWDGCLDEPYVQELGVKLGLLKKTVFDPAVHSDVNAYAEAGDPWYVFDGPLLARLSRPEGERDAAVINFARGALHGDDEHRAWLLSAAEAFVKGQPLPPPNGKGRAEAAESSLAAEKLKVAELTAISEAAVASSEQRVAALVGALKAIDKSIARGDGPPFHFAVTTRELIRAALDTEVSK